MSAFTPQQEQELANLFTRWLDRAQQSTLLRQLQGAAPNTGTVLAHFTPDTGSFSKTDPIPHGFSKAPGVILLDGVGSGNVFYADSYTDTTFVAHSVRTDGAAATTEDTYIVFTAHP